MGGNMREEFEKEADKKQPEPKKEATPKKQEHTNPVTSDISDTKNPLYCLLFGG